MLLIIDVLATVADKKVDSHRSWPFSRWFTCFSCGQLLRPTSTQGNAVKSAPSLLVWILDIRGEPGVPGNTELNSRPQTLTQQQRFHAGRPAEAACSLADHEVAEFPPFLCTSCVILM